jgi:fatty acid desaturase
VPLLKGPKAERTESSARVTMTKRVGRGIKIVPTDDLSPYRVLLRMKMKSELNLRSNPKVLSSVHDLPTQCEPQGTYDELRRLMKHGRFLDKQPAYYTRKILTNFCLLGIGIFLISMFSAGWPNLFIACYLAFVSTQIGFIVHDAGHQQIAKTRWKNDLICLTHANLLLGFSYSWWINTHNQHHNKPNLCGSDPDIDFVFFAFSEEQALAKHGLPRLIVKYQAYTFFPLLLLEAFSLKFESLKFLLRQNARHPLIEGSCLALHYLLYLFLLSHFLGSKQTIIFAITHNALFGLYLGLIFVTNHKGMPLLSDGIKMDFLYHQVLTARNLRAHWLTDYCFGGLSCQIEHHLFPGISLNKLRKAQNIVRSYCESCNIDYYETSLLQCYREVLEYLHKVGAPLRK